MTGVQTCALPIFRGYLGYTLFRIHTGKDDDLALKGAEQVRDVLKEKEQLDNVWVLMGMIHRTRGDDQAGRRCFIKALQLRPTNPDALREMKRMEQQKAPEPEAKSGGFFSRLFGKK